MKREKTFKTYMCIATELANRYNPEIVRRCSLMDQERVAKSIDERLSSCLYRGQMTSRLPSLRFCQMGAHGDVKDKTPTIEDLGRINITYTCRNLDALLEMQGILEDYKEFIDVGADLAFDAVDHWCSAQPSDRHFRDRASANRLIGMNALIDENLSGKDVNVVIVDRGLNEDDIVSKLKGKFGGGWAIEPENGGPRIEPGSLKVVRGVTNNDHGMMIARNILAVAPEACLYDLPLIPPRIAGIPTFLSDAHAAFERVMADLDRRGARDKGEEWILVNAWAPFDRTSETPRGNYSENPSHPFLKLIGQMVEKNIEMVFAAGNCGQYCPDSRCGAYDVGPGKSVHGANAHPEVLTVGAITTHPISIGSSSQGEGPAALAAEKPDLVAPSMFSENSDRYTRNGGTSAACAVVAGVLAALRQRWGPEEISPRVMKQCLRETAWRPGPAGWDRRLGYGVINAEAALNRLAQQSKAAG